MKRVELELEHRYKNRFVGRHIFKPTADMAVVGSARNADLRLLGDEVNGVHAIISYENNVWTISDTGSDQGTWVNKEPIITQTIQSTTVVNIGGHHLKLVPKEIDNHLFTNNSASSFSGSEQFHQVIIRKQGFVIESLLLEPHRSFTCHLGREAKTLQPPKSGAEWVKSEFGDVVIQQRMVNSSCIEESSSEKIKSLVDPSLRKPLAAAAVLILVLLSLLIFAPQRPDDELTALKPEENKYTRIIFDAKRIKQKKEQSTKLRKTIAGRSARRSTGPRAASLPKAANRKANDSAARVVSKIKAAGLSQLIGRISKRASKSAHFIKVANGASPDSANAGPALAAPGTLGQIGAKGAKGPGQFKISGVATAGKAGGSTSYQGVGGLATGNIGNADVGILEEETEIQGGLDREVISQVIKSQLGQIRYCYERQLSANPDIYGKVLIKFTIGGTGKVVTQSIGATTLNNAMVEGCMLRRIAGWKFPKPKGGTSVLVSYPFLFKSTN